MPQARSRKAGEHPAWETHKERLRVLWLEQNEKLGQVMNHMADFHDFHADKWEYEAKFREWDFRKKLKRSDWKIIEPRLRKRKREGKESDVFYHGVLLPAKKVRKEISRNTTQSLEQLGETPKITASNVVVALKTMGRSSKFHHQLLLPKLETGPDHIDLASRMPAEAEFDIDQSDFQVYEDISRTSLPEVELASVNLASTLLWRKSYIVLPDWATPYGIVLQNLPWFQFHALVSHREHEKAIFKSQLHAASGFVAASNQLGQQNENIALEGSKPAISAMETFTPHLELEEIMPASFQIDPATGPQILTSLPRGSSEAQLAEFSLFLTANNMLDGEKLVDLIEQFFEAEQDSFFRTLFQVTTPTVQAFSCRILESVSATFPWKFYKKGDVLVQRLLACGLDRTILVGPTGGRCLQLAISVGNNELVSFLLQNGVRKDVKLGSKWPFNTPPLQLAERSNNQEIRRILGKEHKPTQNGKPQRSQGELSLEKACLEGNIEEIRSLLEAGVDVDSDRRSGEPILDRTFFAKPNCYRILLPYSRFATEFWTTSGIVSAASGGYQELVAYLASRSCPVCSDPGTVFGDAIYNAIHHRLFDESVTILGLEWVLDLIDLDRLLVVAAGCRNVWIVAKLVQSGAEFDALHNPYSFMSDFFLDMPSKESLNQLLDIGDPFTMERVLKATCFMSYEGGGNFDPLQIVKTLVKRGLDLNTGMDVGNKEIRVEEVEDEIEEAVSTPLQLAIGWGTPEIVEYLVDAGAMVNGTARVGHVTALAEAVVWGRLDIVEFLLDKDADIHASPNDKGMTLLELSASGKYMEDRDAIDRIGIFEILLERGADINGPTQRPTTVSWNTALTTAILNPHFDDQIYLALDAGADVNQMGGGKMARTPLQAAAEKGRITIAKDLLNMGAHINAPAAPNHGRTALQAACASGSQEMITLLLGLGADVNAPAATEYGRTALQALCASKKPCSELVTLLVEKGANIHAPAAPCGGITALQGAAIMGNLKIVTILINMGADINAPAAEREGRMALDGAAEHGRLDTVQLLLNLGATCTEPGTSGYDSAIRFAEDNGHFAVADVLMKYNSWLFDTEMFDFPMAGGFPGSLMGSSGDRIQELY